MSLIGTLTSGVSAMRSFTKGLEVIGNNISNVNTIGYKASSASFADTFSNTLRSSAPSTGNTSNQAATQVGTGVKLQQISQRFTQGALSTTGVESDLAISGSGFFVVKNSVDGRTYATRAGNFRIDDTGFLVTSDGLRVQGLTGGTANSPASTVGDIRLKTSAEIAAEWADINATQIRDTAVARDAAQAAASALDTLVASTGGAPDASTILGAIVEALNDANTDLTDAETALATAENETPVNPELVATLTHELTVATTKRDALQAAHTAAQAAQGTGTPAEQLENVKNSLSSSAAAATATASAATAAATALSALVGSTSGASDASTVVTAISNALSSANTAVTNAHTPEELAIATAQRDALQAAYAAAQAAQGTGSPAEQLANVQSSLASSAATATAEASAAQASSSALGSLVASTGGAPDTSSILAAIDAARIIADADLSSAQDALAADPNDQSLMAALTVATAKRDALQAAYDAAQAAQGTGTPAEQLENVRNSLTSSAAAANSASAAAAAAATAAATPSERTSYSIDKFGNVVEFYANGASVVTNRVLLQNFNDPAALVKEGNNLYSGFTAAGPVSGTTDLSAANNTAGTNGLGTIQSNTLELANVDLTEEFANMITVQRSFQASSRLVTVSDSILEEIANLKR